MGIKHEYIHINNHILILEGIQTVTSGSRQLCDDQSRTVTQEYQVMVIYHTGSPLVLCFDSKAESDIAFAKILDALKAK